MRVFATGHSSNFSWPTLADNLAAHCGLLGVHRATQHRLKTAAIQK